jgi:uncharacterized protein involved in type VI secretion and phage assembly
MPEQSYGTKPQLAFAGKRLAAPYDDRITLATIDQDLTQPGYCQITISDPDRDFLTATNMQLGDEIVASASAVAEDEANPIFEGVVHGIDVTFDEEGQSVIVTGFDLAFPLTQHRLSRSFNDVTVGDVITQLCGDLDVKLGAVETASVVHPHVGLFDETPWEFVTKHAAASGCIVLVRDGAMEVVKPASADSGPAPGDHGAKQPAQLVPGHNLTTLRVHSTTARQVGEVELRGWDVANKKELVAATPAETTTSDAGKPADVGRKLGADKLISPRPDVGVQAVCDHEAEALAGSLAAQHVDADGEAIGNPALTAGSVISLGSIDHLSGRYLLTQCRHRFDEEGYVTEFRCTGAHNRSLLELVDGARTRPRRGMHPGVVTNIADPDQLGRVRVKFPWLSDDYESSWARVCQIGAGADRGLLWFPEVDDEVAVMFVDGRPEAPIVVGGLYNGVDKVPFEGHVESGSGKVVRRGFKTTAGHRLELIDEAGKEAVELSSERDVLLEAQGDLVIRAKGKIRLESDADVDVKGSKINLN